jgi:DNA-directed RNA polymerase subunit RPC12/RpoP
MEINVNTATTAELVAYYNANSVVPVKKFQDRATAERRVAELIAEDRDYIYGFADHGLIRCPHCKIHLNNGVGIHRDEVNGKMTTFTEKHEYWCMACGGEFGPLLTKPAPRGVRKVLGPRPEMVKTMKLDRKIMEEGTGNVFKNASAVWKSGLISSSQCDRLSAVLYGAAKAGDRLATLTINGRTFTLANK